MQAVDPSRYFTSAAAAFARARMAELRSEDDDREVLARALAAGLRLHRFKRKTELPRVRRVIGALRQIAPSSLLDIGSGRGAFLWPLLDALPALCVTAIDKSKRRADDLAAVASGCRRLVAANMDAEDLAFDDCAFDVVTLLEVLEHMPRPERALASAVRVAKRFVLVTVPSKEDDNPEHINLFDPRTLGALFTRAGVRRFQFDYVRGHIFAIGSVS
jgi:ubiquinone/menaquinone biosynthesis C-methylase UbiE